MQKRVAAGGLPIPDKKAEIANIRRLLDEMEKRDNASQQQLADLLFSAVNLTRQHKLDSEMVLREKSREFVKIFNIFENLALQKGYSFDTIEFAALKDLWSEAQHFDEN